MQHLGYTPPKNALRRVLYGFANNINFALWCLLIKAFGQYLSYETGKQQFYNFTNTYTMKKIIAFYAMLPDDGYRFWNVGEHISKKVESAEWGQSIVKELAQYIQRNEPDIIRFFRQKPLANEAVL